MRPVRDYRHRITGRNTMQAMQGITNLDARHDWARHAALHACGFRHFGVHPRQRLCEALYMHACEQLASNTCTLPVYWYVMMAECLIFKSHDRSSFYSPMQPRRLLFSEAASLSLVSIITLCRSRAASIISSVFSAFTRSYLSAEASNKPFLFIKSSNKVFGTTSSVVSVQAPRHKESPLGAEHAALIPRPNM